MLLAVMVGVPVAHAGGVRLLSVAELERRVEASAVAYRVAVAPRPPLQWAQQNLELMYPARQSAVDPAVVRDGALVVERRAVASELVDRLEQHFEAGDLPAAEREARALVERFPTDYLLRLSLGDAALFSGRPGEALERYVAAGALSPVDFRSWYFRGNALLALDDASSARQAYARAVALRPHLTALEVGLEERARQLGIAPRFQSFWPGARVERTAGGVTITVASAGQRHWLAWGRCKALWLAEPGFAAGLDGAPGGFSSAEERMCLSALLEAYAARGDDEPDDEVVESVLTAVRAGLVDGFIVYELGSHVFPNLGSVISPRARELVERYVTRVVLGR